jgi:hypothetical protein
LGLWGAVGRNILSRKSGIMPLDIYYEFNPEIEEQFRTLKESD